ncbi:MAG: NADH-quinone oxidoreductase subunit A [Bacteroidota bacterium]|nr:NADH-quinone oxidoreductase subunit A [Bacteroidota bacterium]
MLTSFGYAFVFFLLGAVLVGGALIAVRLIAPRNRTTEKLMTYECGENPIGSPWVRFNIRFYVIALIFILFDVELVVLFPWAVVFEKHGMTAYIAGAIFIAILFLADFYLWAKGDLEWQRPMPRIPRLPELIETRGTAERQPAPGKAEHAPAEAS